MALTFAAVATLAAVGGGWAVQLNSAGRIVALVLLALFGADAALAARWPTAFARPFVALGNRLSRSPATNCVPGDAVRCSLGVAIGLLWAPCAGPILGLILTGAALKGAERPDDAAPARLCARARRRRWRWRCSSAAACSRR